MLNARDICMQVENICKDRTENGLPLFTVAKGLFKEIKNIPSGSFVYFPEIVRENPSSINIGLSDILDEPLYITTDDPTLYLCLHKTEGIYNVSIEDDIAFNLIKDNNLTDYFCLVIPDLRISCKAAQVNPVDKIAFNVLKQSTKRKLEFL